MKTTLSAFLVIAVMPTFVLGDSTQCPNQPASTVVFAVESNTCGALGDITFSHLAGVCAYDIHVPDWLGIPNDDYGATIDPEQGGWELRGAVDAGSDAIVHKVDGGVAAVSGDASTTSERRCVATRREGGTLSLDCGTCLAALRKK